MRYKNYTALDFANDAFFIRWITHSDAESDFFWHTFIRENPSRHAAIAEARQLILSLDYRRNHLSDADLTEMRSNLRMHLLAEKQTEALPEQRQGNRWLAAASILLPLLVLAGYYLYFEDVKPVSLASAKVQVTKNITHEGKNSLILLSDGSRIWLKDSSTITYNEDFNRRPTRDVYLDGEAFFTVAKDAEHPFIVHTSSIKIKVLGTTFSVRSYANDKIVETRLVSGKVHLEQSDDKGQRVSDVELKPNQKAVFHKASKVMQVREIGGVATATWKRDRLVFDEAPIVSVLHQLEMWYGVDIHVDTQKLHCKLTATIEKESLEEVLQLLKLSHGIAYTIDGEEVFIEGSFCKD